MLRPFVAGALLLVDDVAFLVDGAARFDCVAEECIGAATLLVVDDVLLLEGVVLLAVEERVGLFCEAFIVVVELWFARFILCCGATLLRVVAL